MPLPACPSHGGRGVLPFSRRVDYGLSSGYPPAVTISRSFFSRSRRISSSTSLSNSLRRISIRTRLPISPNHSIMRLTVPSLRRLNHPRDRCHHALELRYFGFHLSSSCGSQLVVASAPILRGCPPLRRDPALYQHPLQGGIERTFFHLQHVLRNPLDRVSDLVCRLLLAEKEDSQEHHVD